MGQRATLLLRLGDLVGSTHGAPSIVSTHQISLNGVFTPPIVIGS
jgi:hypothetical protein